MGDFRTILGEIAPVFGLGNILEASRLYPSFEWLRDRRELTFNVLEELPLLNDLHKTRQSIKVWA